MFDWIRRKPRISKIAEPLHGEDGGQSLGSITEENSGKPLYKGNAPKERHDQIEYAFTSGGRHFFKFSADVNIPFQRAVAARDILTENLWQISPDTLRGWNASLVAILTDPKKQPDRKLYEIGILAARLEESVNLSFSLERTLKLASVLYFDEQENPLDYQYPYNQDKIKFWMKHNDVDGFFLNLPDNYYLPSLTELQMSLATYLQAETKQKINSLKHFISSLQSSNTNADLKKQLILQGEMLEHILDWSKGQFTNIT
jgi:hypothetical protein